MSSLARIEELEKKYAESPRRFFAPLANEFRKSGDPSRAIELCRAHLEQQPNHMSGQVVLGQALFDAGMKADARAAFAVALALDPENLIALRYIGDMAREDNDLTVARASYIRLLDVDSRNHEVIAAVRELDDIISARSIETAPIAGSGDTGAYETRIGDLASQDPVTATPARSVPVFSDRWSEGGAPEAPPDAQDDHTDAVPSAAGADEVVSFDLSEAAPVEVLDSAPVVAEETRGVALESAGLVELVDVAPDAEAVLEPMQAQAQVEVTGPEGEFWTAAEEPPSEVAEALDQRAEATAEAAAEPEPVSLDDGVGRDAEIASPGDWQALSSEVPSEAQTAVDEGIVPQDNDAVGDLRIESSAELEMDVKQERSLTPAWLAASPEEERRATFVEPVAPADQVEAEADHVEAEADHVEAEVRQVESEIVEERETVAGAELSATDAPGAAAEVVPAAEEEQVDDALAWEAELISAATELAEAGPEESGWEPESEESADTERAAMDTAASFDSGGESGLDWPDIRDGHEEASETADKSEDEFHEVDAVEQDVGDAQSPTPAVFITETMAQLYEEQGYIEMAAAVYGQLLDRSPEKDRLRAKISELEKRIAGRSDTPRDRRAIATDEGDSARGFFSSLVQVPLRPRLARPYVSGRVEMVQSLGTGSIADAGSPAREAPNALSLDSVFKNGAIRQGGAGPSGFTFDNFFAGTSRSGQPAPGEENAAGGRRRRGEDAGEVEQFNSWLEGLKRS